MYLDVNNVTGSVSNLFHLGLYAVYVDNSELVVE